VQLAREVRLEDMLGEASVLLLVWLVGDGENQVETTD
jgi:hypothetical protein